MKFINYLALIIFSLSVFVMCTSEGETKVKSYNRTDVSDFHMYKGSPAGAEEVTFKNDSVRNAQVNIYFRGLYAATGSMYSRESFEFNDGKATCIFYDTIKGGSRQIVADYEFRNDSLYVFKSDVGWYPIAPGNADSLYQTMALSRFPNNIETGYIVRREDKTAVDLDDVIKYAGYADRSAMIDPADTIIWCNVKYVYK